MIVLRTLINQSKSWKKRQLTPEEYLTEKFQIVKNGLEYIPKEDAKEAIRLTRQENQDKLKEIRDKVDNLGYNSDNDSFNDGFYHATLKVFEILNQYIDGK